MLGADVVTVVTVDQDITPDDQRVPASFPDDAFFQPCELFRFQRGDQAFEFPVNGNYL